VTTLQFFRVGAEVTNLKLCRYLPHRCLQFLYVVLLWLLVNCAGIHKISWFAAKAQPDGQRILLWPPINGFLAERRAKLAGLAYDLDVPNVQKSR